jgi:hypothetical protein
MGKAPLPLKILPGTALTGCRTGTHEAPPHPAGRRGGPLGVGKGCHPAFLLRRLRRRALGRGRRLYLPGFGGGRDLLLLLRFLPLGGNRLDLRLRPSNPPRGRCGRFLFDHDDLPSFTAIRSGMLLFRMLLLVPGLFMLHRLLLVRILFMLCGMIMLCGLIMLCMFNEFRNFGFLSVV